MRVSQNNTDPHFAQITAKVRRANSFRRRASVYVLVIGSATLLSVIGLSSLTAVRIQRRSTVASADFTEARFYAQSAVELGLNRMNSDSNWRINNSNGIWRNDTPIGKGTYTLEVIDPNDADLADSQNDPVVITGTGKKGDAIHQMRVTVQSEQNGLDCLNNSLHVNGNLGLNTTTVINGGETISTNGTCTATTSNVQSHVQAVGAISGGTYAGDRETPITAKVMPAANAFDYYLTNGTSVPFASIPSVSGTKTIEKVVFGPGVAPYGVTPNAQGIYVIDGAGQTFRIRNIRVVGTLVLLNTTTSCTMENSVIFDRVTQNYPSLLIQGSFSFMQTNTQLSEGSLNVNFNPAGAPSGGNTDIDKVDNYASKINGLVYVTGALNTSNYITVNGALIGGSTLGSSGTLDLTHDDTFEDEPPPGFQGPVKLSILPGSWSQFVQ